MTTPDLSSRRASLRQARRNVSESEQLERAEAAARNACTLPWWDTARRIGLYLAFDGELDTIPLVLACRAQERTTFLPRLGDGRLEFIEFDDDSTWSNNRYGILEPEPRSPVEGNAMSLDLLDIVFVPAVGADAQGNRLGMGAGWYDRTFAHRPEGMRPYLVALVHAEQIVERLDAHPWDIPMDAIVTPDEVVVIRSELRQPQA